ncbi:hypothetical protein [Paraburkholderia sp. ZP32-5]|uniref:hypothetical protein n=1 Tax=Paraburkholderia sp. ZP32-5 TaxID=2883245 RepID=UPI001F257D50|nr:hypothetical protein [Paraburkholderia sp. ZP32-5]
MSDHTPAQTLAIKTNGPVENSTGPLFVSHAGKRRFSCLRSVLQFIANAAAVTGQACIDQ